MPHGCKIVDPLPDITPLFQKGKGTFPQRLYDFIQKEVLIFLMSKISHYPKPDYLLT